LPVVLVVILSVVAVVGGLGPSSSTLPASVGVGRRRARHLTMTTIERMMTRTTTTIRDNGSRETTA